MLSKWSENPLTWCLIPFGVSASIVGTAMYNRALKQQKEHAEQSQHATTQQQSNRDVYFSS